MLERRFLKQVDYGLFLNVLPLLVISLLVVASATKANTDIPDRFFFVKRQLLWIGLGTGAAFLPMVIDYNALARWARLLYYINLGLLSAVLVAGRSALGAQRWIQIGPFPLQPSELAKIIMIITLANYLSQREGKLKNLRDLLPSFLHVGIPMLLILKQPDLGTSLVFLAILIGVFFLAGAPARLLIYVFGGGLLAGILAILLHFHLGLWLPLEGYQLMRLIVFINPEADPLGAGYHIIQSRIAIGSGGWLGKGLFAGTQNQLDFLPEQHTDFIFSVTGEELGFFGALTVLALQFFLIWRAMRIAAAAKDPFGLLLAGGVASMFLFHVFINVSMTMGIMPVVGIPLPFVSYGGSAMITNFLAIGLLQSIWMRRQKILF